MSTLDLMQPYLYKGKTIYITQYTHGFENNPKINITYLTPRGFNSYSKYNEYEFNNRLSSRGIFRTIGQVRKLQPPVYKYMSINENDIPIMLKKVK